MSIKIGKKEIGKNKPTFIIAEIGSNHNQNFDLALKHIDAARDAGVDAVKFQTFKAETHISKYAEMESYLDNQIKPFDLLKSLEIDHDWHLKLKKHAEDLDLIFFSSPCDYEAVDNLEKIDVPAYKVASFDLPDLDLIKFIALKKKPIILSTGLADWIEIQRAIDVCKKSGNNQVILLQCTSLYPAPERLTNLNAIQNMERVFGCITGYSDHTIGDTIPLAAVAMGARVIEKHFTLDRNLPGPDHSFGIEPIELKDLVKKIRLIEEAFGDGQKNGPRYEEIETYEKFRRSLHVLKDLEQGEEIQEEHIITKRPGYGIPPYLKQQILGKKLSKSIKKDQWITWDHL